MAVSIADHTVQFISEVTRIVCLWKGLLQGCCSEVVGRDKVYNQACTITKEFIGVLSTAACVC